MAINAKLADDSKLKSTGTVKGKIMKIFKFFIILLLLLLLICGGFALGVYLKFIDIDLVSQKLKLAQYPVIGKYFNKSENNLEIVGLPLTSNGETQDQNGSQGSRNIVSNNQPMSAQNPTQNPTQNPVMTPLEKEKREKELQKEMVKKVSKLARLYAVMKPEEAVGIMTQLDDDLIISILNKMEEEQAAKILALFDSSRAARISQSMVKVIR